LLTKSVAETLMAEINKAIAGKSNLIQNILLLLFLSYLGSKEKCKLQLLTVSESHFLL